MTNPVRPLGIGTEILAEVVNIEHSGSEKGAIVSP